jgi:hypothetical protein
MSGRHSIGGTAPELRAKVGEIIFDLNGQISALTAVKQDTRTIATKILMLETRDQDVIVAGGSLLNNLPHCVDEVIKDLQLHMRSLEHFLQRI